MNNFKFKITRDYYDENDFIYDKSWITFNPGLTVLIGCNGSGKTTLLHCLKRKCDHNNIPVISFDNYVDGGSRSTQKALFFGDIDFVVNNVISSEGEKISNNIGQFASKIGRFVHENTGKTDKIFILMDAVDSGFSIDNIVELKSDLFDIILKDCEQCGITVYLIVSANGYEMTVTEGDVQPQCFNVSTCEYVKINSYDEYKHMIIETRDKKNKRYGWGGYDEAMT